MTIDGAVELVLACLLVWCKTTGPLLLGLLVVGVGVGVLQAATQINEAAIGFFAKLIVMGLALALLGSWSMQNLVDYTRRTIGSIADVVR
ncbi:MAG TPA: flagellar biosynthetic protein FliQ [Polyangiaceae bacterium]|nr:flagellar biosynthetic protein FliQ [Polyangiaceae bacterium]